MNKQDLIALAERVEKAEHGSLELNAAIFRVLKPEYAGPEWQLYGGGFRHKNDSSDARCLPPPEATPAYYTSSLDAAMTLVPAGWDGALYLATDSHGPCVQLETPAMREGFFMEYEGAQGKAATLPLALTAAALRAIAEERGDG